MTSSEVREAFLAYFERQGHRRVPSSPLIPFGDPTLLFVNSGMVQFKDVFLGADPRSYTRATSVQRCLRVSGKHNDLDAVGRTARHHTFFEMLGNFSFGDYFKQDAIRYAWELVTDVYAIDPARLWISVYEQDDESRRIWETETGIAGNRIVGLGEKDNFWAMGDTGPCGPNTEIHVDRGEAWRCDKPVCGLGVCDCDRWLEIYNLVFMQFDRDGAGVLHPLPSTGVDTGMGLERIASVVQGVDSNWDTDLFRPILDDIAGIAGQPYDPGQAGFAHRVIADHARAATFLVADGVVPGNEGRGYVLRRIMRRAIRYGRALGITTPFMDRVSARVTEVMGTHYPEIVARQAFVQRAIGLEEARFRQTLSIGLDRLDELIGDQATGGLIAGDDVFRLYDTYGFPRELTEEVAAERGFRIDHAGYDAAMEQQRELARSATRFKTVDRERLAVYEPLRATPTRFVGYDRLSAPATILALVAEGTISPYLSLGSPVEVILDVTPFYAEGGGQVGDAGMIATASGTVSIEDTRRLPGDVIVHYGTVTAGDISAGSEATASVDPARRLAVARNHTATHLVNAALRRVLGDHVQQAGSLVAPDRLRFDFTHLSAVSRDELDAVEGFVNREILKGQRVTTDVMPFDQAMREGALAFFGDKYGDTVRVVRIRRDEQRGGWSDDVPLAAEPFSTELCGGTHVPETGDVGFVRILGESSIGAGVRRIEAVSGEAAAELIGERLSMLDTLVRQLQSPVEQLGERVGTLLEDLAAERRALVQLQRDKARAGAADLAGQVETLGPHRFIRGTVQVADADGLKALANDLRGRVPDANVALGAVIDGKPLFVVALSQQAVEAGLHAGNTVREMAKLAGGGGGGRPEFGQAGGRDPDQLQAALDAVAQIVAT